MGESGTPNIDIEEGWIDVEHNGRTDHFPFPRQGGSLYHTTKILDTDLLWLDARMHGLRITDLMLEPVYGLSTAEADVDPRLAPHFHYDDIFGTVLDRFLVQAVAGVPLTVYGAGGQTREFLNIEDALQCVDLALRKAAASGELRILNQFTERFSVRQLAERETEVGNRPGLGVCTTTVTNPRKETEEHYYNPKHQALLDLELQPHYHTDDVLADLLERASRHRDAIDVGRMLPRVRWSGR